LRSQAQIPVHEILGADRPDEEAIGPRNALEIVVAEPAAAAQDEIAQDLVVDRDANSGAVVARGIRTGR